MSYMTNFETVEDFEAFMRGEFSDLAGTTESAHPEAVNPWPEAFTGNDDTATQTGYPVVEPSHDFPSNSDFISPQSSLAPSLTHRSSSRQQAQSSHALHHRMVARQQYTTRAINSSMSYEPPQISTRYGESETSGQDFRPSSQGRQRRCWNNDAGTQVDDAQGQPPKKKPRKSRTRGNIATSSPATGEDQEDSAEELGGIVGPSNYATGTVRWMNGVMEWLDEEHSQWKRAGYHRDYRPQLIAKDAQQPGAPFYTEDMGTDYTSFSSLTQGWTQDPNSVIDSKGRRVFSMKKPPADYVRNPKYGPLIYNGLIMLDHNDDPVRDIPGVPLTLELNVPGWLLEGLRRCTRIMTRDFQARLPESQGTTTLTQKMSRWLQHNNIGQWFQRRRTEQIEQPPATKPSHQEPEAVGREHLPPAGTQLNMDDQNNFLFDHESSSSQGSSYEPAFECDNALLRAGPYSSGVEDLPLSLWDTSALLEHGGHADTGHLPMPQSYNSNARLEPTPAYNEGHFPIENRGKRKLVAGSGFDKEDPLWYRHNYTGIPVPWSGFNQPQKAGGHSSIPEFPHQYSQQSAASPIPRGKDQQREQSYQPGNWSTVPNSASGSLSNTAYSHNVAPESAMRRTVRQNQPQSHAGPAHPSSIMANINDFHGRPSISVDTQDSLFPSGNFHFIRPKTAAEVAFVQSMLDYTRAHFKSLMLQEPPGTSHLRSYAEQYREIQARLEEMWPFLDLPPVKLRALGPVFGGMDQW